MRFLLSILLLLLPVIGRAAQRDLLTANIETNGWVLDLLFSTMTNKGTYSSGLSQPYQTRVGTDSITLLVHDSGFDSTGLPVTQYRILTGTRVLRSPYPNTSSNEFIPSGANCIGRFVMSDWIYGQSVLTSLTVRAGSYVDLNAAANLAASVNWATNFSTNLYAKPVANWTTVPFRNGMTVDSSIVAFSHHAYGGQPVACVKFWTQDAAGLNSATQTVSRAIPRRNMWGVTVCEYSASYSLAGLAVGLVTNHFEVFPQIGTNTLSTADFAFAFPTPQHAAQPFLYTNSSYGVTVAFVDPVNGVDSTGRATTNLLVPITNTFATLQGAKTAIIRTNFYVFNRADEGMARIYLTNGLYTVNGTEVVSNYPSTYLTILPYPGVARENIVTTNLSFTLGQMICFSNVTFSSIRGPASLSACGFMWMTDCLFSNNIGSTFIGTVTNLYLTRNRIHDITAALYPSSANNTNFRLILDNDLSDFVGGVHHGIFVGNVRRSGTNGTPFLAWTDSTAHDPPSYPIVAFNSLKCLNQKTTHLITISVPGSNMRLINGWAIVQNEIEISADESNPNAGRLLSICVSATSDETNAVERGIIWNNTFVGQRGPHGFDNASSFAGSGSAERQLNTIKNNSCDNINIKNDKDSSQSGAHLGSLCVDNGVNCIGNVDPDTQWMDPAWGGDFLGIGSYRATNSPGRGLDSGWAVWHKYVNRQSASGLTNVIAGNGDYRLQSGSPEFKLSTSWVLPFDLDGKARSAIDPPGAFTAGNLKKGAMF